MQKIIPCLWFDSETEEAANFYVSVFKNSKITSKIPYLVETPSDKPIGSTIYLRVTGKISPEDIKLVNYP
jgi:predicted 3-demethylubiquinone-9 3-methyltransferase (glyoxalase superfamily)